MGKIALTELMSLGGVMQSPGSTDVPFKYRGWLLDFDSGPEGDRFKLQQAQNADALLLGRVTYEAMQALWATAEGEYADRLNELRSTSSPRRSRTCPGTRPSWATTGRRKWPDCGRSSTARSSSTAAAASHGH